jgi:hypothetical protein
MKGKPQPTRVPEKFYFDIREIAERWGCEREHVEQYIEQGLLRQAVITKNITGAYLLNPDEIPDSDEKKKHVNTLGLWVVDDNYFCFYFSLPRHSDHKFLYLNAEYFEADPDSFDGYEDMTSCVETFHGERIYLISMESPDRTYHLKVRCFPLVITREERDRFEREHGINIDATPDPADYSTPHLDVLREAINHFYNPRRDLDPKRDEVVAWINDRLKERGQGDSDRIATAIFTIIKPEDHNPRRRRG